MKKKKVLILGLLLSFCIGNTYEAYGESLIGEIQIGSMEYRGKEYVYNSYEEALVPDIGLRDVLREILFSQFNETEITQENLKKITFIDGSDRGISNLKGLELCENLVELNLNDNAIYDTSPIEKLEFLEVAELEGQNLNVDLKVDSTEKLKKKTTFENNIFEKIKIDENPYVDLEGDLILKEDVKSGENIQVKFRGQGEFKVRGNLNLRVIYFREDALIKDKNLENEIRKVLKLKKDREIEIKDLEKIKSLNLKSKNITYLDGLENCISLELLNLENNNIKDISSLWNLKNLKSLNLRNNKIEDIKSIESLKSLVEIDMSFNNIRNINSLEEINKLEKIDLSSNRIKDISAFESLKVAKEIYLSNNNIMNIEGLKGLVNLEWLTLNDNEINNFSYLKELENLKELDLENQNLKIDMGIEGLREGDEVLIENIFRNIENKAIFPKFKSNYYSVSLTEDGLMKIKIKKDIEEYKNYKASYGYKDEDISFNGTMNICFKDRDTEIGFIKFLPLVLIGVIILTKNRKKLCK